MAGITLAQAETQLAAYLSAETAVLSGQAVELDGRRLTRANLADIRSGLNFWDEKVKSLTQSTAGTSRARAFAPGF